MKRIMSIKSQCFLLISFMIISCFFISCKEDNENKGLNNKIISLSACKYNQTKEDYVYSFSYYVNGSSLFIQKENAYYNCCIDSIIINSNINDDTLFIYEIESAPNPCNCICPRDIQYSISNIPIGEYIVKMSDTIFPIRINK